MVLFPVTPVLMASLGVRVMVLPSICADALWLNNTKNSNNHRLPIVPLLQYLKFKFKFIKENFFGVMKNL
jgi:hypothetical protein